MVGPGPAPDLRARWHLPPRLTSSGATRARPRARSGARSGGRSGSSSSGASAPAPSAVRLASSGWAQVIGAPVGAVLALPLAAVTAALVPRNPPVGTAFRALRGPRPVPRACGRRRCRGRWREPRAHRDELLRPGLPDRRPGTSAAGHPVRRLLRASAGPRRVPGRPLVPGPTRPGPWTPASTRAAAGCGGACSPPRSPRQQWSTQGGSSSSWAWASPTSSASDPQGGEVRRPGEAAARGIAAPADRPGTGSRLGRPSRAEFESRRRRRRPVSVRRGRGRRGPRGECGGRRRCRGRGRRPGRA